MDPKFKAILTALPTKEPRSRLEPYRELVLEMRKRGRSYREITQVLNKSCGLAVGTSTVNDFVLAVTKSRMKTAVATTKRLLVTNKDKQALIGLADTYKEQKATKGAVSAPTALENIARTIKAVKDQPPKRLKKKVLFEYNPDEPLRLQRNQKSKE